MAIREKKYVGHSRSLQRIYACTLNAGVEAIVSLNFFIIIIHLLLVGGWMSVAHMPKSHSFCYLLFFSYFVQCDITHVLPVPFFRQDDAVAICYAFGRTRKKKNPS